jgi:hypothetical protein
MTCPETSSIINDIEEIVTITTVFSLSAVLSYPPAHIVINEMPMVTGRGSYFTQSSFWPIVWSVTTRGVAPMVSSRWCCFDDVARCLNPLLGQSDEWRVLWDHLLNWLHDCLESHCIEVWIEILNHIVARGPCIGCYRSSYGQVLARAVMRITPGWPHHADMVGFDGRVLASIAPDFRIVFNGILIRSCSQWRGARCFSRRLNDGFPDQGPLGRYAGEIVRPCMRIQTWAGLTWCRWIGQVVCRYSIHRCEMSWRWSLS